MSVLRRPLNEVVRGWLDLNGPLLGPVFYLFESARSYIEERKEAFDARFGTDTAAPVFGRDLKPGAYFYVATTASLIYEILNSLALARRTRSRSSTWDRAKGARCSWRRSSRSPRSSASNSHRICTASRKRTSGATARHPSSARLSICVAWMSSITATARSRPCCSCSIPSGGRRCRASSPIWRLPARKASRGLCRLRLSAIRGCAAGLPLSFERSQKAAPRCGPGAGTWFMRRQRAGRRSVMQVQPQPAVSGFYALGISAFRRIASWMPSSLHGFSLHAVDEPIRSAVCNPTSP